MTDNPALVEKVAHVLTGLVGAACCHRTGGKNNDPKCECREYARAAIAVAMEEAAKVAADNERLRAALEDIAYPNPVHGEDQLMNIARAALEVKDD